MKTCHICELIVKTSRSKTCNTCKRTHCYPCIIRCYPDKSEQLLPKNQADAMEHATIQHCFCCLKECKCLKCNTKEAVVVTLSTTVGNQQQHKISINVSQEENIPQNGLFKGKRIAELPNFMQRIYKKKKILYSKHLMSAPSNNNLPSEPAPRQEKIFRQRMSEHRNGNGESVENSGINQNQHVSVSRENQMEIENDNQNQGDEHQSSGNSSRQAPQNESSSDENENEPVESIANEYDENQQLEVEDGNNQPGNQVQIQDESHSLPNDLNVVHQRQPEQQGPNAVMSEPNGSVNQDIEPMDQE